MYNLYKLSFLLLIVSPLEYLALLAPPPVYPQPVIQEWVRRYPDTTAFRAFGSALALDDSGNVYVAGSTQNTSTYIDGYCTIKYNSSGAQQWVANYYNPYGGGIFSYAIALDAASNVYVTGISYNSGTYFDFCTIKYNSSGVQQWIRFYDDPIHGWDGAKRIAIDKAGNIYVLGFSDNTGSNDDFVIVEDFALVKYSTNGDLIWGKRYPLGNIGNTRSYGLAVDNNCDVYITGGSRGGVDTAITIKYDSSGQVLWHQAYTGIRWAWANDIASDRFGNVYITGYASSNYVYPSSCDYFTVKYTSSGAMQWVKLYHPADSSYNDNEPQSIVIDSSGYVIVSGWIGSWQGPSDRICTIKYTNSGDSVWVREFLQGYSSREYALATDANNNIYVTGGMIESPTSPSQYATIKYDSSGTSKWVQTYRGTLDTEAGGSDIGISKNGNVFVTGSAGYPGHFDMCTIKYTQFTEVKKLTNKIPQSFILSQNYPNPFNPIAKIKYDLPKDINVTIKVYDILGCEVITLVNEFKKAGYYETVFDGTNFASGVYFYRIEAGTFADTKKMVLVK